MRRARIPGWPAAVLVWLLLPAAAGAEPDNLGRLKTALTAYHASGAYAVEQAEVAQQALDWLERRAAAAGPDEKLAIVLDIDETSLSNWPRLAANDFAYLPEAPCRLDADGKPQAPCGADAWNELAAAPAIAPTLRLAERAAELGVAIFFVTGRPETERQATTRNLARVGYPTWEGLFLRGPAEERESAAAYKAPVRQRIERFGYRIVLNMGDQVSDLAGGHAEAVFKLPNPFYLIP